MKPLRALRESPSKNVFALACDAFKHRTMLSVWDEQVRYFPRDAFNPLYWPAGNSCW